MPSLQVTTMTGSDLFAPGIGKFCKVLLREGRFGICSGCARIAEIGSSCATVEPGPCADRFKIEIPFAGQSVRWEVLFNSEYPDDPPDFIFAPEDKDFVPDIDKLPSLVNWDSDDPKALLNVTHELLDEYRLHQEQLVEGHHRLKFEYHSLAELDQVRNSDVEVLVSKRSDGRIGQTNFLIRLPVEFSLIPPYLTKDTPGEDSAVLRVSFQSPEGSKILPELFLSPRVERALGGSANLRIPVFPSGSCLSDYVPLIGELLENKVGQVVQSYSKRREYISAFLNQFGRSVIEYDVEGFSKISFLMEWHDFFFIITIDIPQTFPKDPPMFTFQSGYHEKTDGSPYSKISRDYPYSPRWSADEMASRARVHILENINGFQRESVTEGQLG